MMQPPRGLSPKASGVSIRRLFVGTALAEAVLVAVIALAVRLPQLSYTPTFDELYHVLAARSWAGDGTFRIADGVYTRSWPFTILVGWVFRLMGESLVAARLPSVIAGTLCVSAVYVWTRRHAGQFAAAVAALLLAVDPLAVHLSQLARFYALHGLLFWIAAMATYSLIHGPGTPGRVLAKSTILTLALAGALSLQLITLIGFAGLAVWAGVACVPRLIATARMARLAAGLVLGSTVAVAVMAQMGLPQRLVEAYRGVPLWAAERQDSALFYHRLFLESYPTLWTLVPLIVVVAVASRRAVGSFCAVVFGSGFTIHSVAAFKADRFVGYLLPFLFILCGLAAAEVVPPLLARLREMLVLLTRLSLRPGLVRAGAVLFLVGTALFAAYGNRAFSTTYRMMVPRDPSLRPYAEANWDAAAPILRPLAEHADVVLASAGPKALYYLARLDVEVNASNLAAVLALNAGDGQFATEKETGRPAISTGESFERILRCFPTGLVVIERGDWKTAWGVPDDLAARLAAATEPVQLPTRSRLLAFRWDRSEPRQTVGCPPWRSSLLARPESSR